MLAAPKGAQSAPRGGPSELTLRRCDEHERVAFGQRNGRRLDGDAAIGRRPHDLGQVVTLVSRRGDLLVLLAEALGAASMRVAMLRALELRFGSPRRLGTPHDLR